jgi:hypothetical protein
MNWPSFWYGFLVAWAVWILLLAAHNHYWHSSE